MMGRVCVCVEAYANEAKPPICMLHLLVLTLRFHLLPYLVAF
jgi:hypothetical protein